MLKYFWKIYFTFVLYIIFQNKCCIPQENGTTETKTLWNNLSTPREKCESNFCSCAGFSNMDGVECRDSDEFNLPYIHFSTFKNLPVRRFQGYRIGQLILSDFTGSIDKNFLKGTISLAEFEVKKSDIEIIPNFRSVKDSIQKITINSSFLRSLKGKNLQNLASVTHLSFSDCHIVDISPNVFKGTNNVTHLDLSFNWLDFIPPKLLNPMKNLKMFSVSHNFLVQVDYLFSSTVPEFIHLDFNSIESANYMMNQTLEDYSEMLSSPGSFSKQIKVQLLNLSYNHIKDNSESSITCFRGSNNRLITVEHLLLNGNKLQGLNICRNYDILEMTVTNNYIQQLLSKDFSNKTEVLQLSKNEVRRIDRNAFFNIRNILKRLELSHNNITKINGSIKYLSVLTDLHLDFNSIQSFEDDEFKNLSSLRNLFLNNNQIKTLGQYPRFLQMSIANRQDRLRTIWGNLEFLSLKGNPFTCDCNLQMLLDWLKNKYIKTDIDECLRTNVTSQMSSNCPDMCSCRCSSDGEISFMFLDCSSRNFTVVPHILRNSVPQIGVHEVFSSDEQLLLILDENVSPFYIEDRVLGINLTYNSLESLYEARLPPNLTQLYLSNNKLRWFPEYILRNQLNLKHVSLSGNPWKCDCSTLQSLRKLSTTNIEIQDFDNIRCQGDEGSSNWIVIWELNDYDICPIIELSTHVVLIVLVSFSAFALFCVAMNFLYKKSELNVKVFLYSNGVSSVKEKYPDKLFDAFVSFSHDVDEFVIKEIIDVIEEKDPNIHLCVHYRNFWPGKKIADNIDTAVRNSKMTLVILSRDFLDSEWCLLEFRAALSQSMQDETHRIIVVKLGDLPKKIYHPINAYLDRTSYLTWGEKNFWNKLLFVLPSGNSFSRQIPRNAENIELVLTRQFFDRFA